MKALALSAALAIAMSPALADDLVARQGSDSVRLADGPCQSERVLARLEPGSQSDYKSASAVFQGQQYTACWRVVGSIAHLVYEDGDQGMIPLAELKREMVA